MILGLLENLINHSKSMLILLMQKHHVSIDTILRTIFENYVYLKFVLEKDTDKRAKSYGCSTKLKEIQLMDNLAEDSLRGHSLREFLKIKKDDVSKLSKEMSETYKERVIDQYLNELGMKRLEQKWYNLNQNTKTLKKLCEDLDLTVEYELIYSILSTETHAKDAIQRFFFEKNYIRILEVMKNELLYVSMAGLYLIESVRLIYTYYNLKKCLTNFNALIAINDKFRKAAKR
ncbi:DUF5677 domain-containing protein [Bacillaceae bacterium S4-13-56]